MTSTYLSYHLIANNFTKWQAVTAKDPTVARETSYYLANIGNVKTAAAFLKDQRLFTYALNAFGLQDLSYATGLFAKLLKEGVQSSSALANKLTDPRFKAFAKAFDFAGQGDVTTSLQAARQDVTGKYLEAAIEANAGQQNSGVQLALYFRNKAPAIHNAYDILADKALLQVTQTALGIPASSSALNIDVQARAIAAKLDIPSLQDPVKLAKFIDKFAIRSDIDSNTGSADRTNLLLLNSTRGAGLSSNLLQSLQNLRIGGG